MRTCGLSLRQRLLGAVDLEAADVGGRMQDLAVQVRQRHDIVVDDGDLADAGAGEILQQRRAKPPAPIAITRAALSLFCPGPPTPRSTIWRA